MICFLSPFDYIYILSVIRMIVKPCRFGGRFGQDWGSSTSTLKACGTPARQRQTGRSRRLFSRGPICEKVPAPWRRLLIASTGLQLSGASVREIGRAHV